MISQYHPPSANQDSWRRGSNFSRDMQIFRLSSHHLAEGGSNHREKCKVLGCSLGTATGLGLRRAVHSGHLTSSPPFQVIMARMVFASLSLGSQRVPPSAIMTRNPFLINNPPSLGSGWSGE